MPLRVLLVAAEIAPFAKVGGLADVAGALPKALRALGHDVRTIMPLYGFIDPERWGLAPVAGGQPFLVGPDQEEARLWIAESDTTPVYFVDAPAYFAREQVYGYPDDLRRFLFFSRAVVQVPEVLGWAPDVIQTNDWHTAVIPHWLRHPEDPPPASRDAASLLTIHNLAYQGGFDPWTDGQGWIRPEALYRREDGSFDLLSQGIESADLVTTVSERYAEEITTPEFGEGLDGLLRRRANALRGILNGIDVDLWDPATDLAIAQAYSAEDVAAKGVCKEALQREAGFDVRGRTPLVGLVGRLADQKGFDLVAAVLPSLLAEMDLQVVLLGTGDERYHDLLRELAAHNRRQLAAFLTFDDALARRVYAGCDLFLMPSRFEPCGLGQMIALRYGSVPVVRRTGGLADTVVDYQAATGRGTGFVFDQYDPVALTFALGRAIEVYRNPLAWAAVQHQGMTTDWSWRSSAARYVEAYRYAIQVRKARAEGSPVPRG